jgi:hypothetical protein
MIDTQQQYIKLNIHGEVSIIVVQAHSGGKIYIYFHVICKSIFDYIVQAYEI